ncbi:MAG: beta-ketoacyl synthase N-terminal-like domain-containing protein, partial [Candidatus Sericytochromatia bacterium]
MDRSRPGTPTPLAIVGMACLFPKADGLESFWANVKRGVDGITEVPASHWSPSEYFDADPKKPDFTYARRGGFLSPVAFDPAEFGISPNTLEATDASQLLGLVVARNALRDAGYGGETGFDRDRTSVILGVTGTLQLVIPLGARLGHPVWRKALSEAGIEGELQDDVVARIADGYVPWQENSFPGLLGNVVAGRIANRLDLGGTNCVVDAACASSLSAMHLAAMELTSGKADMVVTGGVDTFNDIFMYMCFSKTPALSPTGDSRPFDADGDGTILGEGLGMVVLKRLEDAERDGDRVYAVIRGVGTSSDGRGKAIYAPSADGQKKALQAAYAEAAVSPETIELLEAHGTGTKVGDATELSALQEVYGAHQAGEQWCALGSVKSQIGHTKAAAGIAGLIKAALALENKVLPPTIKVRQPLAGLADPASPFYLTNAPKPWLERAAHPRRAAVSAFGFGGSNFHAVLEEHRAQKTRPDWDGSVLVAAFSGPTASSVEAGLQGLDPAASWEDLRVAAAVATAAFDAAHAHRLVLVIERGQTDLAGMLANARAQIKEGRASWQTPDGAYYGTGEAPGKLAVLFPGQGCQYVGMGRELACQFPQVLQALQSADAAFGETRRGSRLSDQIYPGMAYTAEQKAAQEAALRATECAQPAIGAFSLGAYRLLADFGVRPDAAAGHSYGELTALATAGRLSEAEFFRLSCLRGQLMGRGEGDRGTMLAVAAPIAEVEALVAKAGLEVVLANKNAPSQIVLSGATEAIAKARAACEAAGMKAVPLPVAAAFHSPLVEAAQAPFREALHAADFAPATMAVYANTTGGLYPTEAEAARDLLAGQLARPV